MEQSKDFEKNEEGSEKRDRPLKVGDTVFARENILFDGKLIAKRNTMGRIVSKDTIHDWRVVFEVSGATAGVNADEIGGEKFSEAAEIPLEHPSPEEEYRTH